MELSEAQKLATCKYNCLQLACGRFKMDGDGNQVNLDATEVLDVADKFYKFVMGDK